MTPSELDVKYYFSLIGHTQKNVLILGATISLVTTALALGHKVFAVDISKGMLDRLPDHPNLNKIQADWRDSTITSCIDVTLADGSFNAVSVHSAIQVMNSIVESMSSGGRLVCRIYTLESCLNREDVALPFKTLCEEIQRGDECYTTQSISLGKFYPRFPDMRYSLYMQHALTSFFQSRCGVSLNKLPEFMYSSHPIYYADF